MSTATQAPVMVQAALWYAKRGLSVFPLHEPVFGGDTVTCTCEAWRHSEDCHIKTPHRWLAPGQHCDGPGKCPRLKWREKSTTDPDTIRQWWEWWPSANVGIDCGKSGLVVLDADLYKEAFDGDLSALDSETVTSITGGGGEHLWYLQPDGCHYGNQTGNLPNGLDIRGEGGYIVAPPSLHKSGNRYAFEYGYALHEINLAPLPQAIREQIDGDNGGSLRIVGPPNKYAVKAAQQVVEAVLERNHLAVDGPAEYDKEGRKWILTTCPFNPTTNPHPADSAAFIIIQRDGHIAAGCHHARCRESLRTAQVSGWQFLQTAMVPA